MRKLATLTAVLATLALVAAACTFASPGGAGGSPGGGEPEVTAPQAAERLMDALVAEDYAAAHGQLSTGLARSYAASPQELQSRIEAAGGPITDYELEGPRYDGEGPDEDKVLFDGTVTLTDGGTGAVTIVMNAIGLLADPWRIDRFEIGEAGDDSGGDG